MNKAFKSAEAKGRKAAEEGKPRSANPYPDKRGDYHNSVTFSIAFRRAWESGWDSFKK